jgi:predicted MPP superfamily phosphohydrolase
LIPSLDFPVFLIFVAVQSRITLLWWRAAGRRPSVPARVSLRAGIVLLDLLLGAGCGYDFFQVLFRSATAGWMAIVISTGTLLYFIVATCALVIRSVMSLIDRRLPSDFDPRRRQVLNAAGNLLIAAPFAALGYGAFIERLNFQVRELDVPLAGLHPSLDGLRLLHLSDIHMSAFLGEEDLARVVDAANELHPHIALVTGDLITSHNDPLDACIRQLARLRADAGVFGCMGNHERYARVEQQTEEESARRGIRFLRRASTPLRFGGAVLNLAGVDHQPLSDRKNYLRGAEHLVQPGVCNILLSHNPDVFPTAAGQGYDLMLAGHTHGGQVSIEILDTAINPARFITPYVYGLYRSGSSAAYVTRGIGTIGIPARIGAPPEITILRLRKA